MNLLQISALLFSWLGLASLGFSFQSFKWFEITDLGQSQLNQTALGNHSSFSNKTFSFRAKAHVGLWGACVVPLVDSLSPSPAPNDPSTLPGGDGNSPTCKSYETTNRLNSTLQNDNSAFERYLLFPRSFLFLSLLFSISGAIICSLLISGVGTTALLDGLKGRSYEEPQQLLEATIDAVVGPPGGGGGGGRHPHGQPT